MKYVEKKEKRWKEGYEGRKQRYSERRRKQGRKRKRVFERSTKKERMKVRK